MNQNKNYSDIEKRFELTNSSKTFNRILNILKLRTKKMLDLGCGYGEYLVKFGENSLGITSTIDEVEYAKNKKIRMIRGNVELIEDIKLNEQFDGIWANNLFEHLLSPHAFLIKLKTLAKNDTVLVLGVPVIPKIVSLIKINKFRGTLASSHINFFTKDTLRLTAERAGWKIIDIRPFIFRNKIIDKLFSFFAPHLYVIAENEANFIYPEKKLKEWKDELLYQNLLKIGRR